MATIKQVRLSDITGAAWPVDIDKVEGFRTTLRQGRAVAALRLREMPNGKYEVLDGFHRLAAFRAEEMATSPATIESCDERTAELTRAEASLDKPSPVLHKRALQAIKETFNHDVHGWLPKGMKLLERRLGDKPGTARGVEVVERTSPLGIEPTAILLAYLEHERAVWAKSDQPNKKHVEGSEWPDHFRQWVVEVAEWFHQDVSWITGNVLAFTLPIEKGFNKHLLTRGMPRLWSNLLAIDDREIRDEIINLARKDDSRWDWGSTAHNLSYHLHLHRDLTATVSRAEILRMFRTLPSHEVINAARALSEARQSEINREWLGTPHVETDVEAIPAIKSDAIFAIASPQFTARPNAHTDSNKPGVEFRAAILADIQSLITHANVYCGMEPVWDADLIAAFTRLSQWMDKLPLSVPAGSGSMTVVESTPR